MNRRDLGSEASKAVGAPVARRQLGPGRQVFNVVDAVEKLRDLIAKTEAFAKTIDDLFENVGKDDRQDERVAYLVTEASDAAQAALAAVQKLADDLVKHGVGT